jgi:hypothetical protein
MPVNTMDIAGAWANVGKQMLGGQAAYERGQSEMSKLLSEQYLRQQQGNFYGAKADGERADADLKRQRAGYQTPEYATNFAKTLAGFTDPQKLEVDGYQRSGTWTQPMPDGQEGPPMPTSKAPDWASPQRLDKYNTARGLFMGGLAGDKGVDEEKLAKGIAALAGTNLAQDRALSGGYRPEQMQALNAFNAADKGNAYHQGANGVLSQITGQETLNAVGRSAAAENMAQAGNANASAELSRSKVGQPQVVIGPDGVPVVVPSRGKMSATEQKETFEADDLIAAGQNALGMLRQAQGLNNQAYSGAGAKLRAVVRSNLPGQSDEADATINLDNLMTGQALESLKSTFGAAPTEGERKILMDLQASADKTPQQRKLIIDRALELAERRISVNQAKAKALRDGSYLTQGYQVPEKVDAGGTASPTIEDYQYTARKHGITVEEVKRRMGVK